MLLFDMAHGPWMFYKRQIIVTRPTAAGRRRSCVLLLAARSIQELVGSSGAGIRFIEPQAEARNRRQPTGAETVEARSPASRIWRAGEWRPAGRRQRAPASHVRRPGERRRLRAHRQLRNLGTWPPHRQEWQGGCQAGSCGGGGGDWRGEGSAAPTSWWGRRVSTLQSCPGRPVRVNRACK